MSSRSTTIKPGTRVWINGEIHQGTVIRHMNGGQDGYLVRFYDGREGWIIASNVAPV